MARQAFFMVSRQRADRLTASKLVRKAEVFESACHMTSIVVTYQVTELGQRLSYVTVTLTLKKDTSFPHRRELMTIFPKYFKGDLDSTTRALLCAVVETKRRLLFVFEGTRRMMRLHR